MTGVSRFKLGEKVTIVLDPLDISVTNGMLKYNGLDAAISKICKATGSNRVYQPYGYELEGCVSDMGIPYTFTKDMLVLVGE